MTRTISFCGAAWALAKRGWPVFPVKPNAKIPLTAHGCLDATTDPEIINAWGEKWPNANVGGACGKIIALDVDPAHGGSESLAQLESKHGPLPVTLRSRTGGDGGHIFLDSGNAEIHNSTSKLGPGLDIRGYGGYVVLPPSIHPSGKRYAWTSPKGVGPAPLPDWLREKLLEISRSPATPSNGNGHVSDPKIPEGARNETLWKKACALRADGYSADAIFALLKVYNAEHCDPPSPEAELRSIADRSAKYPAGKSSEFAPPPIDPSEIAADENVSIPDMPPSVLDGRLGEICRTRMSDFPIAFAWPALLAAASVILRPAAHRTNLYVCLVGPPEVGKSSAVDRANFLLDIKPPILQDLKSGSPEGLLKMIGDQHGDGVLFSPSELSHLLEKAQIAGSTFSYVLNDLFYKDEQNLTIAKGEKVKFHCRLSLVGGVVDAKFGDSFGSATTAGLWDRFLFSMCPTGYSYLWRPPEGEPDTTDLFDVPPVHADVYAARDGIVAAEKIRPRILEIALRCALISAAIDGREELRAADLEPAWELARYQTRARVLLQPNSGKNFEGVVAQKILQYLDRHAPNGQYVNVRQILRGTHGYDLGPSLCERAVRAMVFGGAIEERYDAPQSGPKRRLIRLTGDWK